MTEWANEPLKTIIVLRNRFKEGEISYDKKKLRVS